MPPTAARGGKAGGKAQSGAEAPPKQHVVFGEESDAELEPEEDGEEEEGDEGEEAEEAEEDDANEADSSDEIEEESMHTARERERARVAQRQSAQSQEHAARREREQQKRAAARAAPTKAPRARRAPRAPRAPAEEDVPSEEEAEALVGAADAPPRRLDPALFAAAFARGDAAARRVMKGETPPAPAVRRERGIARGRDGLPITRMDHGRTLVRTLGDEGAEQGGDDAPLEYAPLDARALPDAKARGFKKRKLALRPADQRASALAAPPAKRRTKKPAPNPDDPLGLEDPAFMPGGEFALTGAPKSRRRRGSSGAEPTRPAPVGVARGAGGRVRAPLAVGRTMGAAANFRRAA